MRKIFIAVCAVAVVAGFVSCGGASDDAENVKNPATKPYTEVVAQSAGYEFGKYFEDMKSKLPEEKAALLSKADFLKGVELAMSLDTANMSYVNGFYAGSQMLSMALSQNQSNSVQFDMALFREVFADAFMEDSVSDSVLYAVQQKFMQMRDSLVQVKIEAERKAKEQSPEAVGNRNAGMAYLQQQKDADSTIQTSASGLSYKIIAPGAGVKVSAQDNVKVNYVGKLVDGTVFDKGDGVEFAVSRVVPGFAEGLQLLSKGGMATLYIPSELAYGVDGQPQAGIGPCSMLVFDIEVVDINPKK